MAPLKFIQVDNFKTRTGKLVDIKLSYQIFGKALGEAPIVLVNHALTGNSNLTGAEGWWSTIVGPGKTIDTERFSVLCFNIPGNGYSGDANDLIKDYKAFSLRDMAELFLLGLDHLKIDKIYAVTGCSIGGAMTWQLAVLRPDLAQYVIPIAADYKATDWVLANCNIQDSILNNSKNPIEDARKHAMTFYRTPQSLNHKFKRQRDEQSKFYKVHSWLNHHGSVLKNRYKLSAYKLMNNLLTTIDIADGAENHVEIASRIKGAIHILTVNTDYFFLADENWNTFVNLSALKSNVCIGEIKSIHGHDAFLIEYKQVEKLLQPIFQQETIKNKSRIEELA